MAKSTGNIARVGELLDGGRLAARAALRADRRPLPGGARLLRRRRWRRRRRRSTRLDALVAALDGVSRGPARTIRTLAGVLDAARGRRSAPRSTTTSTSRPALAAVFDLVRELNRRIERAVAVDRRRRRALRPLRDLDQVLGVLPDAAGRRSTRSSPRCSTSARAARAARDWAASDRLRDELAGARDRGRGHARRPALAAASRRCAVADRPRATSRRPRPRRRPGGGHGPRRPPGRSAGPPGSGRRAVAAPSVRPARVGPPGPSDRSPAPARRRPRRRTAVDRGAIDGPPGARPRRSAPSDGHAGRDAERSATGGPGRRRRPRPTGTPGRPPDRAPWPSTAGPGRDRATAGAVRAATGRSGPARPATDRPAIRPVPTVRVRRERCRGPRTDRPAAADRAGLAIAQRRPYPVSGPTGLDRTPRRPGPPSRPLPPPDASRRRTRSSSPAAARSRRRSSRAGRPSGCSSCPQRRQALEKLVLHATSLRIPIVEVEGGSLTALAGFDGHQGIALVVEPRRFATLDDILARAVERGEPPFVLVLDSLEDPQNVGTLLRSAEAAGVHGVIFPTHRQAPLTPVGGQGVGRRGRAPAPRARSTTSPGALTDLHVRGLRIVGAEADAPLTARAGRPARAARDRRRQRGPGPRAGRPPALRPVRADPDAGRDRVAQRRRRRLDPAVRGGRPARPSAPGARRRRRCRADRRP